MTMLGRLTSEPSALVKDEQVYDAAAVRAAADRVIDLGHDAVLVVAIEGEDGFRVSFAVFEFAYGPTFGFDGAVVGGVKLLLVFHGEGCAGALRELRHTYWGAIGDDGYLPDPNGGMITKAFAALQEWFDCE